MIKSGYEREPEKRSRMVSQYESEPENRGNGVSVIQQKRATKRESGRKRIRANKRVNREKQTAS